MNYRRYLLKFIFVPIFSVVSFLHAEGGYQRLLNEEPEHAAAIEEAVHQLIADPTSLDCEPLGGGWSSATLYTLRQGEEAYVLRLIALHRPEERTFQEIEAQKRAAQLGISPEISAHSSDGRVIIMPYIQGSTLEEHLDGGEEVDPQLFEKLGRMLRCLHESPAPTFFCRSHTERAIKHYHSALQQGVLLPTFFDEHFLQEFLEEGAWLAAGEQGFCHGDLHDRNILLDQEGDPWIIDWDAASLDDPTHDLANLMIANQLTDEQIAALLRGYAGDFAASEEFAMKVERACKRFCFLVASIWLDFSSSSHPEEGRVLSYEERQAAIDEQFASLLTSQRGRGLIQKARSHEHEGTQEIALLFLKKYMEWPSTSHTMVPAEELAAS